MQPRQRQHGAWPAAAAGAPVLTSPPRSQRSAPPSPVAHAARAAVLGPHSRKARATVATHVQAPSFSCAALQWPPLRHCGAARRRNKPAAPFVAHGDAFCRRPTHGVTCACTRSPPEAEHVASRASSDSVDLWANSPHPTTVRPALATLTTRQEARSSSMSSGIASFTSQPTCFSSWRVEGSGSQPWGVAVAARAGGPQEILG